MAARPLEWIERYSVPSQKHQGWAVIHIDSAGFLGIVSDYGNFAYHWTHFGDDFKKFLSELEWDYLHGKLMQGRDAKIYDGKATLHGILKHIVGLRREKRLTKEEAREEWVLAKESEIEHPRSDGYSLWFRETTLLDASELYETMSEPQCQMFCQKVWPRFIEMLRAGQHEPVVGRSV